MIAGTDLDPAPPGDRVRARVPELSVIAPAYNERANVRPLTEAIAAAMGDTRWELLVVDDDSPDGTADAVDELAREGYPVRCIRRVGRRGLTKVAGELLRRLGYMRNG